MVIVFQQNGEVEVIRGFVLALSPTILCDVTNDVARLVQMFDLDSHLLARLLSKEIDLFLVTSQDTLKVRVAIFAQMPHEPEQYGIEMVNDITRLMDHLQISKAHIVGYSMGGAIVMKMLVERPDRFLTAVIGGNAGFQPKDIEEQASLTHYLQSGMPFSEAVIAAAPPGTPPFSAEQRAALKRDDPNHDTKALAAQRLGNKELIVNYASLKANKVPVLIIYGGKNQPESLDDLKKSLSNAEYKVILGAGHARAVQSQEFVKAVRAFLQEH